MTFYNLHIPGVITGLEITRSPEAIAAKAKRRLLLAEIRQRRRERYKRFLDRFHSQRKTESPA